METVVEYLRYCLITYLEELSKTTTCLNKGSRSSAQDSNTRPLGHPEYEAGIITRVLNVVLSYVCMYFCIS
jgi:hypothetical protein